jgi:hypothetical protein
MNKKFFAIAALVIAAVVMAGCVSKPASGTESFGSGSRGDGVTVSANSMVIRDWSDRGIGEIANPAWLLSARRGNFTAFKSAFEVDPAQVCRPGTGINVNRNAALIQANVLFACPPDVWDKIVARYLMDIVGELPEKKTQQAVAGMLEELKAETRREEEKTDAQWRAELAAQKQAVENQQRLAMAQTPGGVVGARVAGAVAQTQAVEEARTLRTAIRSGNPVAIAAATIGAGDFDAVAAFDSMHSGGSAWIQYFISRSSTKFWLTFLTFLRLCATSATWWLNSSYIRQGFYQITELRK